MFDYLIVGCGLSGITCGRLLAQQGKKILIVDRRMHVGGNIYDYYNKQEILIHKYGPHIFHTNNKEVWDFVSSFTEWRNYQHRVLSYVNGQNVPIPINLDTINMLYGTNYTAENIKDFYKKVAYENLQVENSKDMVVSKVGIELYELFFKGYTKKQWDLYPEELEKEVTARIPIRQNKDDRYFTDKYQGVPLYGYTKMAENMLNHPNIHIVLNTDYKTIKDEVNYKKLICTGCIDEFFNFKFGKLAYRSIRFEEKTLDMKFYQEAGTINYPNDYDFTRITEYKHLTGQKSNKTTIVKEYSYSEGEPYYPVPRSKNNELYGKYKKEADKLSNTYFLGRLGTYKYLNMDAIVLQAMEFVKSIIHKQVED